MKNNNGQETNKRRGILRALALPVIAGVLMALTPAVASADTSGGTGGGGGAGGGRNPYWVSISGDNAYERFLDRTGYPQSFTEKSIEGTGAEVSVCKRSDTIWFVRSGNNANWSHNYTGRTHGSGWSGRGSIERPHSSLGAAPSNALVDHFKRWDREENGHKIDKQPGYTIICSGAFDVKPDREGERVQTTYDRDVDTAEFTHPYSHTTSVSPRVDPFGQLSADASSKKTAFGEVWDEWSDRDNGSPAALRRAVDQATAEDARAAHASVGLSEANRKAFARGGVLDVHEHERLATITAKATTITRHVETCDWIEKWDRATDTYGERQYINCSTDSTDRTTYTSGTALSTPQQTGFYQMLAVQCYADGFQALMNSDKSLSAIQSPEGHDTPGVVRTKTYDSVPAQVDFGDAGHSDPAKAATGNVDFYTKECAFMCTATPEDTMDNGSDINQGDRNVAHGSATYGAVVHEGDDIVNSGVFPQFRNNEVRDYTLDVWYPLVDDAAGVSYDGSAARETRWIVNADGTPEEEAAFVANGTKLEHGELTTMDGLSRVLEAQSYWSSDEGAPHAISTIWQYDVDTQTMLPNALGFNHNASASLVGRSTTDTTVPAVCYSSYNGQYDVAVAETNNADNAETEYDQWLRPNSGDYTGVYEMELNFQRAIAEGDNT